MCVGEHFINEACLRTEIDQAFEGLCVEALVVTPVRAEGVFVGIFVQKSQATVVDYMPVVSDGQGVIATLFGFFACSMVLMHLQDVGPPVLIPFEPVVIVFVAANVA